jgi:hypothetical protein
MDLGNRQRWRGVGSSIVLRHRLGNRGRPIARSYKYTRQAAIRPRIFGSTGVGASFLRNDPFAAGTGRPFLHRARDLATLACDRNDWAIHDHRSIALVPGGYRRVEPFTVNMVLSTAPVITFLFQYFDSRIVPSPHTFVGNVLITAVAVGNVCLQYRRSA